LIASREGWQTGTGVTMKHWEDEFNAEYQRRQIVEEFKQIRLEKAALRSRVYRPGLFARSMFNFANWMISTGKTLRRRYEIPCVHNTKTESFAH
jgi:hypothetical protein